MGHEPDVSRAQQALRDHASQGPDGRWRFSSDDRFGHTEQSALAIAEACLLLDMPVTDVVTGKSWLRLIDKVVALEERVTRLEQGRR